MLNSSLFLYVIRALRAFGLLVLLLLAWGLMGLGTTVTEAVHMPARSLIQWLNPPRTVIQEVPVRGADGVERMEKRSAKVRDNIRPELLAKNYFGLAIALALVVALPAAVLWHHAARALLAVSIAYMLAVLCTVWHAHHVYGLRLKAADNSYQPTASEIGLIMAGVFYLVPIFSVGAAWLGVERLAPLLAKGKRVAPPVHRNAVCPCGSGKKYKRCCGAAR